MKILILGATSAIAQETAKHFAQEGAEMFLVARNKENLAAVGGDLRSRGATRVEEFPMDLNHIDGHQNLIDAAVANLGNLDVCLIAYGTLGNQKLCEQSVTETTRELNNNCMSIISLITILANYFETQGRGCLAVFSSVAGDRGRQSNYVYGTAKGALTIFLQGVRNRLARRGVTVMTIKPGMVDTPMTRDLKKNALFADPRKVGGQIYRAIKRKKDVVYVPGFWRPLMAAIRFIPEGMFKKLSL